MEYKTIEDKKYVVVKNEDYRDNLEPLLENRQFEPAIASRLASRLANKAIREDLENAWVLIYCADNFDQMYINPSNIPPKMQSRLIMGISIEGLALPEKAGLLLKLE